MPTIHNCPAIYFHEMHEFVVVHRILWSASFLPENTTLPPFKVHKILLKRDISEKLIVIIGYSLMEEWLLTFLVEC